MNLEKDNIVRSIEQMDAALLESLLSDWETYQDMKKPVFIQKIDTVFAEFKDSGDTVLKSYQGMCVSEDCNNRLCSGRRFVGNVSNKYINLIFKQKNGSVNDIFQCLNLKLNGIELEKGENIYIKFNREDKASFVPPPDFEQKKLACRSAMVELEQYGDTILSREIYEDWYIKHIDLSSSLVGMDILLTSFNDFEIAHGRFKNVLEFVDRDIEYKEAYLKYLNLDISIEIDILKWLVEYEKLWNDSYSLLYIDFREPYTEEFDSVDIGGFKIELSDYRNIVRFHFAYENHIWEMKSKYEVKYDNPDDPHFSDGDNHIISQGESEFNGSLRLQLLKVGIEL